MPSSLTSLPWFKRVISTKLVLLLKYMILHTKWRMLHITMLKQNFLANPVGEKDEKDPEKQTGIHIVLLRKTDGKPRVVKAIYSVICFLEKRRTG